MSDFDPPAPPPPNSGSNLRAAGLKNMPIIIRPERMGQDTGNDGELYDFVIATVWVIDRAGVTEASGNVRFSWRRAMPQLSSYIGKNAFIACRPVQQDDNSVILLPLEGEARVVAEKVIEGVRAGTVEDPTPKQQAPTALMQAMVDEGSIPPPLDTEPF